MHQKTMSIYDFSFSGFTYKWISGVNFLKGSKSYVLLTVSRQIPKVPSNWKIGVFITIKVHTKLKLSKVTNRDFYCILYFLKKINFLFILNFCQYKIIIITQVIAKFRPKHFINNFFFLFFLFCLWRFLVQPLFFSFFKIFFCLWQFLRKTNILKKISPPSHRIFFPIFLGVF